MLRPNPYSRRFSAISKRRHQAAIVEKLEDRTLLSGISVSDLIVAEGNAGTTNAAVVVSLDTAASDVVTVNYATTSDTATAGADFTAGTGSITFNVGETVKIVNVPIIGDTIDEINEEFNFTLSSAVNATLIDANADVTITDDDPAPLVAIADATAIAEGNVGTTNAIFTVSLSAISGQAVTVNYATAAGTAVAGEDYVATSGSVVFNPGETVKTVSVAIVGDLKDENNESLTLDVQSAVNAGIADAQGQVTITDDDPAPSISIIDVIVPPAPSTPVVQAQVVVNLSAASGKIVTVDFTTANGTALSGSDYTTTSGTLTFAPGETSKTIFVNVTGNTLNEFDENFFVNLSNEVNATISDTQAIVDVQGDSLLIVGTGGIDDIDINVGAQVGVDVNGTLTNYATGRYLRYFLDGLVGNDVIAIHGTSANESVRIDPGHMVWNGTNLMIDATSFTSVEIFGGGGTDTAVFYDTAGNDVFTSLVTDATLTGSGLTHTVHNYANINVYAYAGGTDLANLYDTAGVDRFIGRETRSNMTGAGYNHSVSRFERVNAYAYLGGYDLAYLHGSTGDDRFVGRPDRSTMRSSTYFNMATSFEGVYAFAVDGGNDTALLIDSAGDDFFFGSTISGSLSGAGYLNQANNFDLLEVQASTGFDDAEVIDVAAVDTVFGSGSLFDLTRSGGQTKLTGFNRVTAGAMVGETPTSNMLAIDYEFIEEGTWT